MLGEYTIGRGDFGANAPSNFFMNIIGIIM